MFTFHFSLNFITSALIDFFIQRTLPLHFDIICSPPSKIYICRHHLSACLLTFTLILNFFWLVITATANLHSIVNGIGYQNFERINLKVDLSNFRLAFGEDSDSDYFGWYFWHLCQYPEEVTDT